MVTDCIEAFGHGPHGLDHEHAVDVVWMFNDPSRYRFLVRACGWSERQYAAWIADQMHHGLGLDATRPASGSAVHRRRPAEP